MSNQSRDQKDSLDVFQALFGSVSGDGGSSLFTNNLYKRKPEDQKPSTGQILTLGPTSSGDDRRSKRAKFVDEGMDIAGSGGGEEKERKKKRKRVRVEAETNMESEMNVESAVVEAEMKGLVIGEGKSSTKRRKKELESGKGKKRKRKEIEEEYEAMKYGAGSGETGAEEETTVKVGQKRKFKETTKEIVDKQKAFDDEDKLRRTVFVGNLPLKVKKKALLKEFSRFGEVESVRIRSVPLMDTKMPRKSAIIRGKVNDAVASVNAYIVYKDDQSASSALSHNMAKIGDNHIRVDRACPPRKKAKVENPSLYDSKRTIFVGNIPFDVKDEELYQLFCHLSKTETDVEAIRVVRDPHTSMGKGIAYVLFKSRDAANMVMRKKSECKLRDRELRICYARHESTPKKRENPTRDTGSSYKRSKTPIVATREKELGEKQKLKVKTGVLPYQGLRATKGEGSGRKSGSSWSKAMKDDQGLLTNGTVRRDGKVRMTKRPAVAARKVNSHKAFSGKKAARHK